MKPPLQSETSENLAQVTGTTRFCLRGRSASIHERDPLTDGGQNSAGTFWLVFSCEIFDFEQALWLPALFSKQNTGTSLP